jgi:hypothetical protein
MKGRIENIALDDVLDLYLDLSEQSEKDVLEKLIIRYPQFENELREFAALQMISDKIPDREYTAEEVQTLEARAVSIVQNVLYEQRHQSKAAVACDPPEEAEETITGILDEATKRKLTMEFMVEESELSEGMIRMCDSRQIRYETLAVKAIENLARVLGILVSTLKKFLRGALRVAPSHYKARQPPKAARLYDFSEVVQMDDDLTPEQQKYWLSQPPIGSEEDQ